MSILINADTKIIVQGITGREGSFHAAQMIEYGSKLVAGVTPGKGGSQVHGVPVFDTVRQAAEATGAQASCIFVPAPAAPDALLEAAAAGLEVVVCITEGIPVHDMIRTLRFIDRSRTTVIGPNCPGLLVPGRCKIGIIPGQVATVGPVAVISRSGTLTYEIVAGLTAAGLGQTICVGVGGDPVLGTTFVELLPLLQADPATRAVVLIGEIGGADEENAAEYIKTMTKPVVGFISGRTAPPGKRMGHAGAIISGRAGTARSKVEALQAAGAAVADTVGQVPKLVEQELAPAR